MKNIITVSGGISSAYVAWWAKNNLDQKNTIYYFNDTKWEHPDLYRFLSDIEKCFDIIILHDNDGRNPEQLFKDQHMLGNNRAPICSKELKAKRLQKFCKQGDNLYFGIDRGELKRAARISSIYDRLQCKCYFPIIDNLITHDDIKTLLTNMKIEIPYLYKKGFKHNNCSGGCVRAGIGQWKLLYYTLPDIFRDRERVEYQFNVNKNTNYSFIKGLKLSELRQMIEENIELPFDDDIWHGECIGICDTMN